MSPSTRNVAQPGHRRPADARFGVLTREETQGVAFVGTELVDGGGTDARVGVFPPGLRTKLLENTHHARNACKSQASP